MSMSNVRLYVGRAKSKITWIEDASAKEAIENLVKAFEELQKELKLPPQ